MTDTRLFTERLELRPLPAAAAGALVDDRETAARLLGVALSPAWPHSDLLDVLPLQAAAGPDEERFGVWVLIEREAGTVVGDIGFRGPPGADGAVEIGYSVIPDRRRRAMRRRRHPHSSNGCCVSQACARWSPAATETTWRRFARSNGWAPPAPAKQKTNFAGVSEPTDVGLRER